MDVVLSTWTATWGLPPPGKATATAVEAGHDEPGLEPQFVELAAPPSPAWSAAMSLALFGFDARESAVFKDVTQRCTQTLRQALTDVFGTATTDETADHPWGHAGVRIQVLLLGLACSHFIGISRLRSAGLLPSAAAPAIRAVNLECALADTPVPLVAELGQADIGLDELLELAPGDVLLLQESLDVPLRVVSPGSALAMAAHLGVAPDAPQRAARWLAI